MSSAGAVALFNGDRSLPSRPARVPHSRRSLGTATPTDERDVLGAEQEGAVRGRRGARGRLITAREPRAVRRDSRGAIPARPWMVQRRAPGSGVASRRRRVRGLRGPARGPAHRVSQTPRTRQRRPGRAAAKSEPCTSRTSCFAVYSRPASRCPGRGLVVRLASIRRRRDMLRRARARYCRLYPVVSLGRDENGAEPTGEG